MNREAWHAMEVPFSPPSNPFSTSLSLPFFFLIHGSKSMDRIQATADFCSNLLTWMLPNTENFLHFVSLFFFQPIFPFGVIPVNTYLSYSHHTVLDFINFFFLSFQIVDKIRFRKVFFCFAFFLLYTDMEEGKLVRNE